MIVLCDGMIVLAYDQGDVMTMLLLFVQHCGTHNTILNYAKTWLGFQLVMFFVLNVWYGECELVTDREDSIRAFGRTVSLKGMQCFTWCQAVLQEQCV